MKRELLPNRVFASKWTISCASGGFFATFIPKNACSTLRLSAALYNGAINSPSQVNWIHKNNRAFNADDSFIVSSEYAFVILRCPFARLVSVFLDKFVGKKPSANAFVRGLDNGMILERFSFSDFILGLSAGNCFLRSNEHWRPQVDFLIIKNYDDYFSVEDLGSAKLSLLKKVGFNLVDSRSLLDHSTKDYVRTDINKAYNLSVSELSKLKRNESIVPCLRSMFTPGLYERVSFLYGADVELYESKTSRKSFAL